MARDRSGVIDFEAASGTFCRNVFVVSKPFLPLGLEPASGIVINSASIIEVGVNDELFFCQMKKGEMIKWKKPLEFGQAT
ncbi:MAG: hypothetical protein P9L94_11975 [Candidatus Hinthialibacter antarcticus]|nr:hypothetical protein [Candidatus Hinthialibacter antarcticus]